MEKDLFKLQGKVALVTGASSGLGIHFAQVLADAGATVILAARSTDKLNAEVQTIVNRGGRAFAIAMDVTDAASVSAAFEHVSAEHQALDILINNAGVAGDPKKFLDTTEEDWSWIINTNLTGAWRVAKAATELMIKNGTQGSIVNTASIYGVNTGVLKVAYNASKTGVVQLTKSMAMELCRHSIRVNALCPGWFLTSLNSDYFHSENGKRYTQTIPMKRLGTYDDLTAPLLLLASNSAGAYMTGSCLVVDGGISESPI
ncbi:MAG: SDR family NAD(P)-dependent oxidoreductase [Spongiibacteraceae bacterium]